jgi:hypothetical protein
MRKYIKYTVNSLLSLALFIIFVSFVEKQNVENSKQIARRGRGGGHHGGRHHGHRHHRDGFRFRFYVGPSDRYYYDPYYYRYVRVNCEVSNEGDNRVVEVQIGDKVIYTDGDGVRHYYVDLRPGYYNIRWRVSNERYFGSKYRNFSRRLRVYRDADQIYVKIRGSNISIY